MELNSFLNESSHASLLRMRRVILHSTFFLMLCSNQILESCSCSVAQSFLTLSTPWAIACQSPLSMGFSRQEYWGGLPFPSPGDLSDPGIEPRSPAMQADSLTTELWGKPNYMVDNLIYWDCINVYLSSINSFVLDYLKEICPSFGILPPNF